MSNEKFHVANCVMLHWVYFDVLCIQAYSVIFFIRIYSCCRHENVFLGSHINLVHYLILSHCRFTSHITASLWKLLYFTSHNPISTQWLKKLMNNFVWFLFSSYIYLQNVKKRYLLANNYLKVFLIDCVQVVSSYHKYRQKLCT